MTNPRAPQWTPPPAPPPTKPKRRKAFLIFFLIVQGLFVIWLISGISSVSSGPEDCGIYLTQAECEEAFAAGAAIGTGLVIAIWAAVDIILGITYGIYRLVKDK